MKESHRDKIVVIGAGNVGEAIAYTLMVRVQANDIVLVDLNEDRAEGAALDIAHGTSFLNRFGSERADMRSALMPKSSLSQRELPGNRARHDWTLQRQMFLL